jgi:hypothetical protein
MNFCMDPCSARGTQYGRLVLRGPLFSATLRASIAVSAENYIRQY